ncbi:MAG: hypothetical protein FWE80_05345 [Oscillospiraceae bacterium]|nr:hypothetical protein [Oscillospiraceae bacterium]
MRKRPFWKRINRGLVVLLAAAALVGMYIVVVGIDRAAQKREILALADEMEQLAVKGARLSPAELEMFQSDHEEWTRRITGTLKPFFTAESPYLEEGVEKLGMMASEQQHGRMALSGLSPDRENIRDFSLDGDVGYIFILYRYEAFGEYDGEALDGELFLDVTLTLKKTADGWRIFNISALDFDRYNYYSFM